jgi:signal transduction histidine kinase
VDDDRDFLQRVGHDLRNELNIIKGATDFVLRYGPRLEPKYHDMLQKVANASKRFELMMNEFDDARWIGNGTWPHPPEKDLFFEACSAALLVASVFEKLKVTVEALDVDVEVDVPEDLPAVRADPRQSTNALEYVLDLSLARSAGKTLRVEGHVVEGQTTISITDDGSPMDPALATDLLEPFRIKKFVPKPSKNLPGVRNRLGLGLAIARSLFTAQGGGLCVEIKPEGGLAIHCVIGRSEAARVAGSSSSPSPG